MDLTFSKLASGSLRGGGLGRIFLKPLCSALVEGYHFRDFVLAFLSIFVWSEICISSLENSAHHVELEERGKPAACAAILDVHARILLDRRGYLSSMRP